MTYVRMMIHDGHMTALMVQNAAVVMCIESVGHLLFRRYVPAHMYTDTCTHMLTHSWWLLLSPTFRSEGPLPDFPCCPQTDPG